MEGGKLSLSGIKKTYNKNIKNSKLGTALRKTTGNILGSVYDKGENKLGQNKFVIHTSATHSTTFSSQSQTISS